MERNANSGIYVIRCDESGKVYVGSASNIARRWDRHRTDLNCCRHHSAHLQRAWSRYGGGAFTFCVVESVLPDRHKLMDAEQRWLDDTLAYLPENGYNTNRYAWSTVGFHHSTETRKRMSDARKGRALSDEQRAKISEAQRGKPRPYQIGQKRTVEQRRNIAASLTGKHRALPPLAESALQSFIGVLPQVELALMFGISKSTVTAIKKGRASKVQGRAA